VPSQWAGSFPAAVTVLNPGCSPADWALTFGFPQSGRPVGRGRNGTWLLSGGDLTAPGRGGIAAAKTRSLVSLGVLGAWSGNHPVPASCQFNRAVRPETPALTAPPAGPTPSPSPSATPEPTAPATATAPVAVTRSPPAALAPRSPASGNRRVTAAGPPGHFYGVNRSGEEFPRIKNRDGIRNGRPGPASVTPMQILKIRTVGMPLDEECRSGTTGNPVPKYSGGVYRDEAQRSADLLAENGITLFVERHRGCGAHTGSSSGGPGDAAVGRQPKPGNQYSPAGRAGVVATFKRNDAVVFGRFNGPYPKPGPQDVSGGWKCWRGGSSCTEINCAVSGFRILTNTARAAGATAVTEFGGRAYSGDPRQWLTCRPADPLNNLVAEAARRNDVNACPRPPTARG
jgi:endoglucanase